MPINIPDELPAASVLRNENIFVMNESRALSQDIRPLKIVILNLMPTKVETEIQLMRLLSNTPLQIDITLLIPATHESKHISKDYLDRFYKTFGEIKAGSADICPSASTARDVTTLATKSADGKKAFLLVVDYFGRDMAIPVSVKGVEGAKNVSARVLSFEKDLEPVDLEMKDGAFTLRKPDAYSAAFLVTFDL